MLSTTLDAIFCSARQKPLAVFPDSVRPVHCCRWKLLTGNRAENGCYRTIARVLSSFFFRRGLLTSKQRTNLHWKTNVPCYSWTNSRLFLQFRKTPFWLKQVRSYASMLQGIFPFWARDAFLPPFSSVVTQTKIAIIFHSTCESWSLPHSLILIPTLTTSSLPSRALTQLTRTANRIKINKGPNWEKWCHIDLLITQALPSLRHLAWWMGCDWLTVGCFEWVLIRPWCQTTACVN